MKKAQGRRQKKQSDEGLGVVWGRSDVDRVRYWNRSVYIINSAPGRTHIARIEQTRACFGVHHEVALLELCWSLRVALGSP